MSVVSYLLEHKVTVLKIVLAVVVITGATIFAKVGKNTSNMEKAEVLGRESDPSIPSNSPNPSSSTTPDLFNEAKKNVTAFLESPINTAKNLTNNVLGETTRLLQNTASKSAETVTQTIIQTTVETIVKQIDKLPVKEKEEIKQTICK